MPFVEFRPFSIKNSKGCRWDFSDYCKYLGGITSQVLPGFHGHDRIWLCHEDDDFVYGCIITNLGPGGGTTLDLKTLVEKEWATTDGSVNHSKNLLVFSKKGRMGIYQSQSEAFPMSDLNRLFNFFSQQYRQVKIANDTSRRDQEEKEEQWKGHIFVRTEMTEGDFLALVKEMKEVRKFSWSIDVTKNKGGMFTPEIKHARRTKGEVAFTPTAGESSGIGAFVRKYNPFRGKVIGKNKEGLECVYYLQQKYEVMEKVSLQEWKKRWDGKPLGQFLNTKAIKTMVDLMKQDKARFLERK